MQSLTSIILILSEKISTIKFLLHMDYQLASQPHTDHYRDSNFLCESKTTITTTEILLLTLKSSNGSVLSNQKHTHRHLAHKVTSNQTHNSYETSGVPAGSPSHGGDVAVYVFDINQLSLPTPFYSVLASVSVFMALSTLFHSINSSDNSLLSDSVLLVLFLPYCSFQLHISL